MLSLSPARRNQVIVSFIASVVATTLWVVGDPPSEMFDLFPVVIGAIWVPSLLFNQQRAGGVVWNTLFALLGLGVLGIVVRTIWLIGRG